MDLPSNVERCLEIMGLRKNGARKGDTRVYPLTRVPLKRACSFLCPNTFKRRCLEIMGLRKNGARKGDTRVYPLTRVPLKRACSFLCPNTFKRLPRWLCSIRTIQQRRCCRQQSAAIDSIVFLQFSTANVICTKSFDQNFCKIKRF